MRNAVFTESSKVRGTEQGWTSDLDGVAEGHARAGPAPSPAGQASPRCISWLTGTRKQQIIAMVCSDPLAGIVRVHLRCAQPR